MKSRPYVDICGGSLKDQVNQGAILRALFRSGDFFLAEAEHLSSRSRKALALLNTLSSLDHPEALPGASGCPDINSVEVQHVTSYDPLVFSITSSPNRY